MAATAVAITPLTPNPDFRLGNKKVRFRKLVFSNNYRDSATGGVLMHSITAEQLGLTHITMVLGEVVVASTPTTAVKVRFERAHFDRLWPGPVNVTMRKGPSSSHSRRTLRSSSRPRRAVSASGSDPPLPSSNTAACVAARPLATSNWRVASLRSSAADNAFTVSLCGWRRCPRSNALTA